MKLQRVISNLILWGAIILIGCTPATPETSTPDVHFDSTATVVASNTETPTTIPTAVPSMEVGSTYYYVDGTTLVAVPAGEFSMTGRGSIYIQDNLVRAKFSGVMKALVDFNEETQQEIYSEEIEEGGDRLLFEIR